MRLALPLGAPGPVVLPDKPSHLSALGDPRGPLARMAAVGAVIVALAVMLFLVAERNEGAGAVASVPAGGGTEATDTSAGGLAPPGLWVDAATSGAQVFVDGARVGVVPIWLDSLPSGLRRVRVVDPEGRTLADTTVTALAGDVIDLDFGGERRRQTETLAAAAPTDRSDAERPTPVARRPEPGAPAARSAAPAARSAAPATRPAAPAGRPAAQAARRTEPRPAAPRAPSTGELRVTSSPSGADVQLDGRFVGVTPLAIDGLRRGQYAIAVRAPGYEIVTQPVVIQGGGVFEAAVQLQLAEAAPSTESPRTRPAPAPSPRSAPSETGTLEVLVRPWGRIVIDGATHQRETDVVYRTVLAAGEHRVTASHPELGSVTRTVTVAPGEALRVEFDLARDGL